MQCSRGSMTTDTTHSVLTLKTAQEWYPEVTDSDLPITVDQERASNGRLRITIHNNKNKMIHRRG